MATALRIISLLQSLTLDNQDSTKAENIIAASSERAYSRRQQSEHFASSSGGMWE